MVHVLSTSVLCEHLTARGSVNACRGCHVFEGFHFRHYFPSTCRNSTCFYGCILLIQPASVEIQFPSDIFIITSVCSLSYVNIFMMFGFLLGLVPNWITEM